MRTIGPVSNGEASESAGSTAWRLLGGEAWRLLSTGQLRAASQLAAALSAIGGSVPALLLSCKPPDLPQPTPSSVAKGMWPFSASIDVNM